MQANQQGKPIEEESISFSFLTLEERKQAVDLLFKYLNLQVVRTNVGYGTAELEVRPVT